MAQSGKRTRKLATNLPKPVLVKRPNGRGALLSGGVPGHDGSNAGRPPLAFKHFLAKLREDPTVQAELEATLKDRDSKAYSAALKLIADYDDELPANLTPEQRKARVLEIVKGAEQRRRQG